MAILTNLEILDLRNPGKPRSAEQFKQAVKQAQKIIDKEVSIELAACQQDALLSLLADIVSGAVHGNGLRFEDSLLLRAINAGEHQIAAAEFCRFVYVGKRVDADMWRKRDEEQLLYRRGHI